MANWCEGTLKVRGTKEDIKRFLIEGLSVVNFFGQEVDEKEVSEDEWSLSLSSKYSFYIKETRRNFIESDIEFYFDDDNEIKILAVENYKAAWGIDAGTLATLSKNYNIDFKIYAFEKGMEFNQDIEIHKGKVIKNEEIQFNDYAWECISPQVGG